MSFAAHTTKTADEALAALKSGRDGLSGADAEKRLRENGPNELARDGVRWYRILSRQFTSPFLYLLIGAAGLAAALGEMIDASMIAGFVLLNAGLGFSQEYHSERTVEMLRTFVKARARVRRGGKETLVDSKSLVPGDLIIVETGDVIQADVRFVEETDLSVDESVLTGESVPVKKMVEALKGVAAQAFQAVNVGFAGTTVVSGRGVGVVIATGSRTQIGNVAELTSRTEGQSAFEKSIGRFSTFILRVIVVTLVIVFAANVAIKGAGVDIPELLIFSIALAVSVIPEALPLVTTTTLSRGALRLAKKNVVVKRLSAIEDLGSIEILCTDKTGTITENKMEVADVRGEDECVYLAAVASSFLGEKQAHPNNAFDIAVWNKLDEAARARAMAETRTSEVPFDPARRYNSVVAGGRMIVRGALEEVAALCAEEENKKIQDTKTIFSWAAGEGVKGRRVLAIASSFPGTLVPSATNATKVALKLVGAISFEDPVKASAEGAIEHAKLLGVDVKILTGDSREVAAAVARRVGLIASDNEVTTGAEWEALPEAERFESAKAHAVFVRVSPEQKYLIIQSLRGCCEVGFLGEGINDAPALKVASVGIVVDGASDIAREAADIVLLEHSLEVIVGGIREGREVFANTVKYIKATLASNFGNFLAVAIATLLVDYLPMLPVQILLVNLLSDFPMIAIATDSVDPDELKRPRSYDLRDIVYAATVLGVVSTVFDFIFFALFSRISPEVLHTNWFIASILTELVLIFSVRTRLPFWKAVRPSGTLFWLSLVAAAATIVIPFTALGQKIFSFVRPPEGSIPLILGIVVVYFIVTETVKRAYNRTSNGLA